MRVMERVRSLFGRDDTASKSASEGVNMTVTNKGSHADEIEVQISDPGPDTDTCKIVVNRDLSPDKTEFFETYAEAEGWPMVPII